MDETKKKRIIKIVCIALVAVIVVGGVLGGVLGGYVVPKVNAQKQAKAYVAERQNAVASVKFGFLSGVDANWDYPMSDEEIADLENAGDYVLAVEWLSLVEKVMYDSPLLNAKIKNLGLAMQSENGKKLLGDFGGNAELLIPLLREVDFTSEDVATLVTLLLNALVDESENTLVSARDKLVSIKSNKSAKNVANALAAVNAELGYVAFTDPQKQDIKSALEEAKDAIEELAIFAYNTSIKSFNNHISNVIASGDGALADITDGEIQTVVQAMLGGFRNLKSVMTEEKISKLNNAILMITDVFDGNVSTSKLFSSLVNYAKFAYAFTDSIPYLCDIVLAFGDSVDGDFLTLVRRIEASNGIVTTNQKSANLSILAARLTTTLYGGIEQAEFNEFIGKLYDQAVTDYRRSLPLIIADLFVNLTSMNPEDNEPLHPEILSKESFEDEFSFFLKYAMVTGFENAYYDYLQDGDMDTLVEAHRVCKFEDMGIVCPYDRDTDTKRWFDYLMTRANVWMNEEATRLALIAKNDLLACTNDYYAENSPVKANAVAFAERAFIAPLDENATEEERAALNELVKEYIADAKSARVFGIAELLRVLFAAD